MHKHHIRKRFLIFIFWQLSIVLFSQPTKKNLTSHITYLFEKADSFTYLNIDSALYYANLSLKLSEKENDATYIFKAYRTIGFIYEENNRLQKAQNAYKKALNLAEIKLSDFDKCTIYTDWAIIHKKLGQYLIAQDYHWRTIEKAKKTNNWELIETAYNGLGTLFAMMSDYEKAIVYYHESIAAAEKWGNKLGIILTQENISSLYLNTKNYDLARQTIEKAYNMALSLGDSTHIAATLSLDADIEMALGRPKQALSKYQKAKTIFEQKGDKPKLGESYLSLGSFYFEQKNYIDAEDNYQKCQFLSEYLSPFCYTNFFAKLGKLYRQENKITKAIEAFTNSLQKADTLGLTELARENHLSLANLWHQQNQPEKAYQHLLIANSLSDTLYTHAQFKNLNETQLRLDLAKRDLQIENQQHALTQSLWVRSILGILLLIVLVLLYFVWRQMKAKLHAMQHIELLMKELHHRVKNNLQTITSIMRLQARHITDPKVAAVLGESRSRLEAISMIHQQLYRSDDVQSVNFKLFLENLVEKQLFTHGFCNKAFDTEIKVEKEFMNVELALPLGLIINELLTNSFKYAYPSVKNPKLLISIDGQNLLYSDNGQGLPPQFTTENPKSFGIQLIVSLAQQLRGKFQFGNQDGMFFKLSF